MQLSPSFGLACAMLLAAGAAEPARAECELHGPETGLVGDTLAFTLSCSTDPDTAVYWDFGDGETLAGSRSLTVRHAYPKPGRYEVFVRVPGVLIPYARYQSVLFPATSGRSGKSSSLAYDAARKRIWLANADNHTVTAVDAATWQVIWEKPVGGNPRSLALDADGRIWAVNQDDATLSVLDGKDGSPLATLALPYASRPYGLALDPSGRIGYLTLEATGRLLKLDLEKRAILDSLAICPSPRAVAVSRDGAMVYVGRFISPSDQGEVHVVAADTFRKAAMVPLRPNLDPLLERDGTNGRGVPNALAAIAFAPDGRYAYVTATKENTLRGTFRDGRPLSFEHSVRAVACRLDLATGKEDFSARTDIDNSSRPADVVFTRSGSLAFVSDLGTNHVLALDPDGHRVTGIFRSPEYAGPTYGHLLGPAALALDEGDSLLFVQYAFSRELGVFDVSGVNQGGEPSRLALIKTVGREILEPQVLFGKQVFNNSGDTRMSREGYTSCGTCHMEGGTDGRVWDFTDRGEGLRRTTSLQGRAGTGMGPVHWSANFDEIQDFEHDIRGPFGGTGFMADADFNQGTRNTSLGDAKAGLSPELDALAAYMTSLAAVHPSPYRNPDGTLTDDGEAGRKIFERAETGCARCHGGPDFTDSKLNPDPRSGALAEGDHLTPEGFLVHDVGTLLPGSGQRLKDSLMGFDTPTLKGIWEFGPYLHDGSAATLMDVITTSNPADRHGHTSQLTGKEKEQLIAYLLQIDDLGPDGVGIRRGSERMAGPAAGRIRLREASRQGFRFSGRLGPGGKPDYRDARGRHAGGEGGR